MPTDLTNPMFTSEDAARAYFEGVRWPPGPVCPHCGVVNEATLVLAKVPRVMILIIEGLV
jgi:Transposase zinc-ribbon domain